jgi:hypothetical protein
LISDPPCLPVAPVTSSALAIECICSVVEL